MVKFYENSFNYEYPFPAVSLAYFLRYPNPYATHVLSTDIIDRHFDPATQQLKTTRLHLKKSKLPPSLLAILPRSVFGGGDAGQSYILEKSVVDVKEGWMETESKNLEWTGILSVIEKQTYRRPLNHQRQSDFEDCDLVEAAKNEGTDVITTVTLLSRLGQGKMSKRRAEDSMVDTVPIPAGPEDDGPTKNGLFASWSTSRLQKSIELIGLRRTREALGKSKEGMNIVLERLRNGGLVRVLEGMQQDKQRAFGQNGPWKQVWRQGQNLEDDE